MVAVSVNEATSVLLPGNVDVDTAASAFVDNMEFYRFVCTSLKLDQIQLEGGTTLLAHAKACDEEQRGNRGGRNDTGGGYSW